MSNYVVKFLGIIIHQWITQAKPKRITTALFHRLEISDWWLGLFSLYTNSNLSHFDVSSKIPRVKSSWRSLISFPCRSYISYSTNSINGYRALSSTANTLPKISSFFSINVALIQTECFVSIMSSHILLYTDLNTFNFRSKFSNQ